MFKQKEAVSYYLLRISVSVVSKTDALCWVFLLMVSARPSTETILRSSMVAICLGNRFRWGRRVCVSGDRTAWWNVVGKHVRSYLQGFARQFAEMLGKGGDRTGNHAHWAIHKLDVG